MLYFIMHSKVHQYDLTTVSILVKDSLSRLVVIDCLLLSSNLSLVNCKEVTTIAQSNLAEFKQITLVSSVQVGTNNVKMVFEVIFG